MSRFSSFDLAQRAACYMDDKLAKQIVVLDTQDISTLADYFIIASAESVTQVKALTAGLKSALAEYECIGYETDAQSRWHLLDFGDVIIHVMHQSVREFYQLDAFWNHAAPVTEEQWKLKKAS